MLQRLTLTGNNVREEGLVWAHSFREHSHHVGKAMRGEAVAQIDSAIRKQRADRKWGQAVKLQGPPLVTHF